MTIAAGECVILYLGTPREQVFGVLLEMTLSGIVLRGISVSSVDDWLRELSPEWAEESAGYGLATTFYPMHRVEKMTLDEPSFGAAPIQDRFSQRTGITFVEFVERERVEAEQERLRLEFERDRASAPRDEDPRDQEPEG